MIMNSSSVNTAQLDTRPVFPNIHNPPSMNTSNQDKNNVYSNIFTLYQHFEFMVGIHVPSNASKDSFPCTTNRG